MQRFGGSRVAVLDRPTSTKIPAEKDDEEVQLEKLVFGDDEAFQQALRTYDTDDFGAGDLTTDDEDEQQQWNQSAEAATNEVEEIADDELFFVDTGVTKAGAGAVVLAAPEEDENDSDAPAWFDEEEEKLVVSLASNTRLRKLRTTEAEDLVDGKEYIRRLQQQFERLYPRPAWAIQAEKGHRRKRRRMSRDGDSADEDDSDDSIDLDELDAKPLSRLLQSTDSLTETGSSDPGKRITLRSGVLDIQRSKDIGTTQPSAVTSLSFHPTKPLVLTSGPSGLLNLYHLSSTSQPPNPCIHTLSVPRHPIHTSAIHPSGDSIYFAGRRPYFLNWSLATGTITRSTRLLAPSQSTKNQQKPRTDQKSCERFVLSPCGRYIALVGTSKKVGTVNILSATTAQWICQARIDGKNGIADLSWWCDGNGLVIVSKSGDVIEYSIEARQALARWKDDDVVSPTAISLGGTIGKSKNKPLGGDRWLAIGQQSGIVSIYDRSTWSGANPEEPQSELITIPPNPKPIKTLSNLTTAISHVVFSPDSNSQILAISSRWKKDALRLVHTGSWTVYPRWPTAGTPLGRVTALAMREQNQGHGQILLVVGSENGRIRTWEIRG